jgi:uroporphyrinogen decarboxylase
MAQSPAANDAHLREFAALIKEGGFIPTVDHTVPPEVSWENFQHSLRLLGGEL